MKSRLILANWLLSVLLITYDGDSIILTLLAASYFSLACYLLVRCKKDIAVEIKKMEHALDALINRFALRPRS